LDELSSALQKTNLAHKEIERLNNLQRDMVPVAMMDRKIKEALSEASDELAVESSSKRKLTKISRTCAKKSRSCEPKRSKRRASLIPLLRRTA
jgi:hypothetical protein